MLYTSSINYKLMFYCSHYIMNNETYLIKCAKKIVKEWFDSTIECGEGGIFPIGFRSNRKSGVWVNYPLCKFEGKERSTSLTMVWNEYAGNMNDEYVPTYEECIKKFNLIPESLVDVVCSHKGHIAYCIDIVHKNNVTREKINVFKKMNIFDNTEYYTIDAMWVMEQTGLPTELVCKKIC